tara:strand:- start:1105 stop:2499 length:1395 start_codon:yes stop_codon:yes gene_type:complete
MALNPFFLQGSVGEQNLMQELINEQLKIYGVEITYIPRKIVNRSTVFEELERSKFDDNFLLEAYVETFDGYGGQGDIMTKFGMTLKDELTVSISRERFEDFIAPFMEAMPDDEMIIDTRPREGDLVFFPLGNRLFEVKFVEHEDPFYQLGKNYIYKLQCELFEYEDEVIDTGVEEIDTKVKDLGHITDLPLVQNASTATATATIGTGGLQKIFLTNDGSGFTSVPTISISAPPAGGTQATAVGVLTTRNLVTSLEFIYLTHAGAGYGSTAPIITISGGGGTGAAATCSLVPAGKKGLQTINITNHGVGYSTSPTVAVSLPSLSPQLPATAHALVGTASTNPISDILILDAGAGFFSPPTITIGAGATVGVGTFWFNEEVVGQTSNVVGRVKNWDEDTGVLQVGIMTGTFYEGERLVGSKSGATYETSTTGTASTTADKYSQNDDIEFDADQIIDFSESNPFGTF